MLVHLLACAAPDPIPIPPTEETPTAPTTSVELLSVALEARCPGVQGTGGGPPGEDLHRVTLADATARCNDGTPPALFVRRATDPAHADDWVVFLEGGSFCSDHETCAARWCGETPPYDASKMSSAWYREAIGADGMRSPDPSNAFAGWNHAQVAYCSSDFWIGERADHVFEGDPPYRLQFEGSGIVRDALDALEVGVSSDDLAETLPSLTDAATVLFSGSSAGGYGAVQHVSAVADRLPGARVIGVIDSMLTPSIERLTEDEAAGRLLSLQSMWESVIVPVWDGALEARCLAANADPWRCSDVDVVLQGSEVELAVHQDLFDPVLYPSFGELGMSEVRLAEAWSETLRGYADTLPGAALHGTRCTHHTALSDDQMFARLTVDDEAGTPWSLHDLLEAQVGGARPVAIDGPDGARTTCP